MAIKGVKYRTSFPSTLFVETPSLDFIFCKAQSMDVRITNNQYHYV